ncbi:MAG: AEC family transporter [Eubacterium sp.]|nr:AEC family transporter [Lachnospiraceae bacterium]MBO5485443.1 AEC family transporter [Eubacterium sp.]
MLLLQQMIVLFILMGIGFLCYKLGMITDEVSKKLSAIVVNIANPALVLTGCMGEGKIQGKELLLIAGLVIAVYAVLLLLAMLIPIVLKVDKKSRGTYQAMTIFSNIGFMGFPVVSALYGSSAILYAALFTIPYNILIYTFGVAAMSTGEKTDWRESFSVKRILNVGVIACIITIIVYLFQIPVPEFLELTVTHLSNLTAPLSMMVIGASLAAINIKKLFTDGRLLLFSALKLLVIPVAGVLLIRQLVDNDVICGVCMVMLATPVGSMTAMLAQQYDGDYEMASKGVALTTILSVATMPLVSMIVG